MAQFKRVKRDIHGVLLLDKSLGISSNQALQQVKHLYQAAKAGHTGSLDPLASGLLPLCFGHATKFSHFLLDADKSYMATIKLGETTTTADAEGEVLTRHDVNVSLAQVQAALTTFIGQQHQVPPMYSALKHQGKALYEYARAGIEITREAREVTIHAIQLHEYQAPVLNITVTCSKGTYIRTLAADIGERLGCGAHLIGLRRTATAQLQLPQAHTFESLQQMSESERIAALLPIDATIDHLPIVKIDEESAFYLMRGQQVWKSGFNMRGQFRIYCDHQFLGLGEQDVSGRIAPKRLVIAE